MNMHEQETKPLNWHLWQCRLGWTTEWLDTNHAILSHVGSVSKALFWLLVVGGLSPSCLCSSDSVGTPPDYGVVYPYDTFQTLRWGSLASFISETQPEGIVIVGVWGGIILGSKHVGPWWIWPQVTPGTSMNGSFILWSEMSSISTNRYILYYLNGQKGSAYLWHNFVKKQCA